MPARVCILHFRFRINAQRVGDAVDVIEIGNDLDGVEDVAVGQAVFAQLVHVPFPHRGGFARHELGEFPERPFARRKFGARVIVLDVLGQRGVAGFLTEILPVRFDSIKAVIRPGNYGPQQFPFGA